MPTKTVPIILAAACTLLRAGDLAERNVLIEPAALAAWLERADAPLVLDCRDEGEVRAARIPGAVRVDVRAWREASRRPEGLVDEAGWSARIGALGITAGRPVVVYDAQASYRAATIRWLLRYWGVRDVRLLNGGWPAWRAAGLPVTTDPPVVPRPAPFRARPDSRVLATKQEILRALAGGEVQVLDVRSPAEYTGKTVNTARGGHIPGAINIDWKQFVHTDGDQRFAEAARVRDLLTEAGIDPHRPVIVHCRTGARSSVAFAALEAAGVPGVENYYLSFAEWSRDPRCPVTTGAERGTAPAQGAGHTQD